MERELEDMDTTNQFVKDLHQDVVESVKVSLNVLFLLMGTIHCLKKKMPLVELMAFHFPKSL